MVTPSLPFTLASQMRTPTTNEVISALDTQSLTVDTGAINSTNSSGSESLQASYNEIEDIVELMVEDEEGNMKNANDMVYVGMIFESEDDAHEKYNEFARKVGFGIRKGNSYKRSDGTVRSRVFVCFKEGFRQNDHRAKNVREHKETRTGCKARMMIKQNEDEWVASSITFEHNHLLLTPRKAPMLRSHRRMKDVHKGEIQILNAVGIPPVDGFDYMVQQAGGHANVGITQVDYKKFLRKKRAEELKLGDASTLVNYFTRKKTENSCFFYDIMFDDENQVTNLFWADAMSIIDYNHFGDVVVFDTTYRTNKYGRPFAPFVGVNHHKESVFFGGALLIDETAKSFVWLFETWMKAMGRKKPRTIFTDQCPSMAKAISQVFPVPETNHRLCLWHIFLNGAKHLSHVYKVDGFTKTLKRCIYNSETVEEFESRWNKMLEDFDLVDNDWLVSLYKVHKKWALVYGRDSFCADMTTTQRSESINNFLKKFVKRKYSLTEFVNRYEKALARRRHTELVSDFEAVKSMPKLLAPATMLKQAADSYTYAIYKKFEEEYKAHLLCKLEGYDLNDGVYEYKVTQEERRNRIVQFDRLNCHVVCGCKKFEFAGIICCHIIKVLYHWNIHEIPIQYILKRWTKDAKSGLVIDRSGNPIHADCNADTSLRYNELCHMAINCAVKGSVSEDVHLVSKLALEDALKKIESAIKASQDASTNTMRSKDSTRLVEEHLTVAEGCEKGRPKNRLKNCLEVPPKKKQTSTRKGCLINYSCPVKDAGSAPEVFSRNLGCVENDNRPYIPHGFEANHIPGLHHNVTGFPHGLDARHVPSLDHNMPHIPHGFEASQSMGFEVYPVNTGDTSYPTFTQLLQQGSSAPALEIGDASYPTFTQLLQQDPRFHGFESRPPTGFKVCSTNDGDTASMQPSLLNSMPQPLIRNNMQRKL